MSHYQPPIGDILHVVRNVVGLGRLQGGFDVDEGTIEAVLHGAADFVRGELVPLGPQWDAEGCRFENGRASLPKGFREVWRRWCQDGWESLAIPEARGGQGMPELVAIAVSEMASAASIPFGMMVQGPRAAARLIDAHAPEGLADVIIPHFADGSWTATIVMTEPAFGSDAGRIVIRAMPSGDGRYAITGEKVFISFADHDAADAIMHIVLARLPGAPTGPKGVSLFLVPSHRIEPDGSLGPRNQVQVTRIEQKLGLRGSPTCAVSFDAADAVLLGQENHGLAAIFAMANTMRLETGLQGVALGAAATERATRYALERVQGVGADGKPATISEHVDVRRMLAIMKSFSDGARTLMYETALQLDLSRTVTDPDSRRRAEGLSALLLPICKAFCSYGGVESANLGIQVHGGYGYVRDHGAEQILRDARIAPLYEGTNGIQAIDLLTRKIGADPWRLTLLLDTMRADLAAHGARAPQPLSEALADGIVLAEETSRALLKRLRDRPRDALAGAAAFLELLGRLGAGWSWLRMATCERGDPALLAQHRALANFYAAYSMADLRGVARQALLGAEALDALKLELFLN